MKKILSILTVIFALVLPTQGLLADSANKHPFVLTQPDGSTVTLVRHGDEFFSYTTDLSGNVMEKGPDGFYRKVDSFSPSLRTAEAKGAEMRRLRNELLSIGTRASDMTRGSKKFLVILIEWQDLKFKTTNADAAFRNLLNQAGYSVNGSIGSAKDYYIDASLGQFNPSFDVFGPVTLPFNHNDFPDDDAKQHYDMAAYSISEALKLFDNRVNFADYDIDHDGFIDNIYCFYAGEAQSNGGGDDTIWPHASSLYKYSDVLDGVRPMRYACSSELVDDYSRYPLKNLKMCGIGTFCHEFGHVLGLPDYYDTDYEKNGLADHPDNYSLMAGGSHNSGGYIPPYMNNIERECLGWYEIPSLLTAGTKTLQSLGQGCGLQLPTKVLGERFILELRDGTKWDATLPKGMVIYHADASDRDVLGTTASARWKTGNGINIYGSHPCLYLVPAYGTVYNIDSVIYPGMRNVTSFVPKDWDGGKVGDSITDITYGGGTSITFQYNTGGYILKGKVTDTEGNPVGGATVSLAGKGGGTKTVSSLSIEGREVKLRISNAQVFSSNALVSTTTADDGSYFLFLSNPTTDLYDVMISKERYMDATREVDFSLGASQDMDFVIKAIVIEGGGELTHYDMMTGISSLGMGSSPQSISGASRFEASEVESLVGCTLQSITIPLRGTSADNVYVLMEAGKERLLTVKISGCTFGGAFYSLNTVDLSSYGIKIPANKDIIIGYIVENIDSDYPLTMDLGESISGGVLYYLSATTALHEWYEFTPGNLMIFASFTGPNHISDEMNPSTLGINYISLPSESLSAGQTLPFTLVPSELYKVKEVNWFFDGNPVGSSVVLTSGVHEITAEVKFEDSHKETIKARISID